MTAASDSFKINLEFFEDLQKVREILNRYPVLMKSLNDEDTTTIKHIFSKVNIIEMYARNPHLLEIEGLEK